MASVKLTQEMRRSIAEAMCSHKYAKKIEAAEKLQKEIALKCVDELVLDERDHALIPSLPEGYLPRAYHFKYYVRDKNGDYLFSREVSLPDGMDRRVPFDKYHYRYEVQDGQFPEQIKQLRAVAAELDRLRKERHALRDKIIATLMQFSTTGRAKDQWPNAAAFIEKFERVAPAKVPLPVAQTTQQLDAEIGLPA